MVQNLVGTPHFGGQLDRASGGDPTERCVPECGVDSAFFGFPANMDGSVFLCSRLQSSLSFDWPHIACTGQRMEPIRYPGLGGVATPLQASKGFPDADGDSPTSRVDPLATGWPAGEPEGLS